ncbi:MAG: peptide chain release factor N(5)-glutamine methyltransferase [Pseudomonadota bacterium]
MSEPGGLTVAGALRQAKAAGLSRLEAQQLAGHLLGRSRTWLIAHEDEAWPRALAPAWAEQVARRAAGEPLAYLIGEKEFHGLRLEVSPAVLVPRADTETLVDWALDRLASLPPDAQVLDLGTGSGAIALALQHARPQAAVWAVDASPAALEVARRNAQRLELAVQFLLGDWWEAVPARRFHLIVSNPPYIAEGDRHLPALRHEPRQALTSGPDGLDDLRHLIAHAPAHLRPGGWLLLEHGYDQAVTVAANLKARGFEAVQTRLDSGGIARCTGGLWRGDNRSGADS